jgi:excisionase family DNA binding protein
MTDWLTTNEAAEYLKITPEVVRQKARRGTFSFAKVGQEFRFSKDALDAWLKAGGDAGEKERAAQRRREEAAAALAEVRELADQAISYLEVVGQAKADQVAEALEVEGVDWRQVEAALTAVVEDAWARNVTPPVGRTLPGVYAITPSVWGLGQADHVIRREVEDQ